MTLNRRPLISTFSLLVFVLMVGCTARSASVTFPHHPTSQSANAVWYDTDGDGKSDFAFLPDTLAYDDDEDGTPDRLYRLSDYANESVPHLILLLDSIPFQSVVDRCARGEFAYFDKPVKVVGPFPSLSEQIFSRILGAPPLPGMIDDSFDPRVQAYNHGIIQRVEGYHQPWEYRCNYVAKYWEAAFSYLDPRKWYQIELARSKRALDESPDRVTIVYLVSASGMACKYGQAGIDEVLDGVQRLCLQLLHERRGAIKISICADHGHNLVPSTNVQFDRTLKEAGFHVTNHVRDLNDVAIDLDGLVTYLGLHTKRPASVADAVLKRSEVELVTYMKQDRVIVRNHNGSASIECHAGRFRYTPVESDVLQYSAVIARLKTLGKVDADGFIADADWFDATIDEPYPDGPQRLWNAFHEEAINPPDVMIVMRDGFCAGHESLKGFITMKSTHGGLNQINSATFLLTMTGRVRKPLRSGDIIRTVEPGYVIPIRMK